MKYWFEHTLIILLTLPMVGIAVIGTLQDMGAL